MKENNNNNDNSSNKRNRCNDKFVAMKFSVCQLPTHTNKYTIVKLNEENKS